VGIRLKAWHGIAVAINNKNAKNTFLGVAKMAKDVEFASAIALSPQDTWPKTRQDKPTAISNKNIKNISPSITKTLDFEYFQYYHRLTKFNFKD
jgi:hypothetical protein